MDKNLDNIIRRVLLEYYDPYELRQMNTYDSSGGIGAARMASKLPSTGNIGSDNRILDKQFQNTRSMQASSCVPSSYVGAISRLKDSGASTLLLKAVLGIIGRESDFGGGESVMSKKYWSYKVKSAVKNLALCFAKKFCAALRLE